MRCELYYKGKLVGAYLNVNEAMKKADVLISTESKLKVNFEIVIKTHEK